MPYPDLNVYPGDDSNVNEIRPNVSDLSRLMRARTLNEFGVEGEFNTTTRPTAEQVDELIDDAYDDVRARLGDAIPERLYGRVKRAVGYRAAMLVEASYWPEQAGDDASAFQRYSDFYNDLISSLDAALKDDEPGSTVRARFNSIPALGTNGLLTVWPDADPTLGAFPYEDLAN